MKKLLMLIAGAICLASCHHITGSGNIVKESRTPGNFSSVAVSNSIDAQLTEGPLSVGVETDDNIQRYVETYLEGNTLHVKYQSNTSITNGHTRVYISAPSFQKLDANTSSAIVVSGILKNTEKIVLDASTSARIDAAVDAPVITAKTSTSATIVVKGRTRDFNAKSSTSGNVDASALLSENAVVSANTSGDVHVNASVTLDADASTSGDIRYRGGAKVNVHTSTSGSVSQE